MSIVYCFQCDQDTNYTITCPYGHALTTVEFTSIPQFEQHRYCTTDGCSYRAYKQGFQAASYIRCTAGHAINYKLLLREFQWVKELELLKSTSNTLQQVETLQSFRNNPTELIARLTKKYFLDAAISSTQAVQKIISSVVSIYETCTDEKGKTGLHLAAEVGNVETLQEILSKVGNKYINKPSTSKDTPLHSAVENQKLEAAKFLIEKGANVNATNDKGNTPLHIAVSKANIEIVKLLLSSNDLDMEVKNVDNQATIDLAISANLTAIAVLIANKRKEVKPKVEETPKPKPLPRVCFCPISGAAMKDPVILCGSGVTYERSEIQKWFQKNSTDPKTNKSLDQLGQVLIPNNAIKLLIEGWESK